MIELTDWFFVEEGRVSVKIVMHEGIGDDGSAELGRCHSCMTVKAGNWFLIRMTGLHTKRLLSGQWPVTTMIVV